MQLGISTVITKKNLQLLSMHCSVTIVPNTQTITCPPPHSQLPVLPLEEWLRKPLCFIVTFCSPMCRAPRDSAACNPICCNELTVGEKPRWGESVAWRRCRQRPMPALARLVFSASFAAPVSRCGSLLFVHLPCSTYRWPGSVRRLPGSPICLPWLAQPVGPWLSWDETTPFIKNNHRDRT